MKKLMILACVAMGVAFAANANSVKWSFMNNKVSGQSSAAAVDFSVGTWTAYLVVAADWTDNKLETLQSVKLDSQTVVVASPNPAVQTSTVATQTPKVEKALATDVDMLMVITDGNKYLMYAQKADIYDEGDPLVTPAAFSRANVGPNAATTAEFKDFAGGSDPIPEPTSGLLLLLGVAGLALKRRHA